MTWGGLLAVAGGGFVGGIVRAACSNALNREGRRIPWGTLLVNLVGSFIVGVMIGVVARAGAAPDVRLLVVTGFCGGLTTFSTFTSEVVALVESHEGARAWWYWVGSVLAGLLMAWCGIAVGR